MFKYVKLVALFCLALSVCVSVYFFINREAVVNTIGGYYYKKLQKLEIGKCITGDSGFVLMKNCLDKIGHKYSILGDTTEGNFRVTISKPFAEAYAEVVNWEYGGDGAGMLTTFQSQGCFIHFSTPIPSIPIKERELITKYVKQWFELNPEAMTRYILGARETASDIVIRSAPLLQLKNFQEYCPDSFGSSHLDDRQNIDLDETRIKK